MSKEKDTPAIPKRAVELFSKLLSSLLLVDAAQAREEQEKEMNDSLYRKENTMVS